MLRCAALALPLMLAACGPNGNTNISIHDDCVESTLMNTTPMPVTTAASCEPATWKVTSVKGEPIDAKAAGCVNARRFPANAALV